MTRVFHLASDLGPVAAAKQLALVAPALSGLGCEQMVGVLGGREPFADVLAAGGVEAHSLLVRHAIDVKGLIEVDRAVANFWPDVLHAWGPLAARVGYLLRHVGYGRTLAPAVVVTGIDSPGPGLTGWLTRKALRSARAVTVATDAEADRMREAVGVAATVIPLAASPPPPMPDPAAFRKALGIPENGRLIVSAGGFDAAAGLRTAVWAFDILKYADTSIYYVLFGDGPERSRAARFSKAVGFDDDRVRFAGSKVNVAAAVGLAEVAWVTHLRGGVNFALEAMAAGVPVVAFHNRDVADAIEDGVTGRLVPMGDRIRLAAATTELLEDPAKRARLGAAGRAAAETRFAVGPVVDRFAALYHDVTSATP